jgi:ATP-dependent DNA helicase RecQ
MEEHLKEVYGYNKFRAHQKEIILDLIDKKDVVAILPTGGGKSLLYQFPATFTNNITIVVSPLISLMNDQCKFLNSNNIKSVCLNSETSVGLGHYINYKIIYTTPEFIITRLAAFSRIKESIGLFAIDEAHCVSQWSHDFRPSYQKLGLIKKRFPNIPVLSVTATATPHVLSEMYEFIKVTGARQYLLGTRRTNLIINVKPKSRFKQCTFDEPTIIYVQTRKMCEKICKDLISKGITAAFYHGGMEKDEKDKSHELFINGEIMAIVATISFGMGIDKGDIRHVVNFGPPANIETYYQEIGRAGRDGIVSKATIYYDDNDFATTAYLIEQTEDEEQKKIKTDGMEIFQSYLQEPKICRQQLIDHYFATGTLGSEEDVSHIPKCGMCDNCTNEHKEDTGDITDITREAEIIVKIIKEHKLRRGFDLGSGKIIKMLRNCASYAEYDNNSDKWIKGVIDIMVSKKVLTRYKAGFGFAVGLLNARLNDIPPIKTRMAKDFKKMRLSMRTPETSISKLMSIRDKIAKKFNIIPTSFINDRVIMNIHEKSPKNISELWEVDGISNEFIMTEQCQEFMTEYTSGKSGEKKSLSPKKRGNTREQVIKLYKQGKTIKHMSEVIGVKQQTIENHILNIFEFDDDFSVDLEYFDLTEEKEEQIKKAIKKVGTEKLRPIKDIVGKDISYGQIKVCMLAMKVEG